MEFNIISFASLDFFIKIRGSIQGPLLKHVNFGVVLPDCQWLPLIADSQVSLSNAYVVVSPFVHASIIFHNSCWFAIPRQFCDNNPRHHCTWFGCKELVLLDSWKAGESRHPLFLAFAACTNFNNSEQCFVLDFIRGHPTPCDLILSLGFGNHTHSCHWLNLNLITSALWNPTL